MTFNQSSIMVSEPVTQSEDVGLLRLLLPVSLELASSASKSKYFFTFLSYLGDLEYRNGV